MKWSSFTLNPKSPDVAEVVGLVHEDDVEHGAAHPQEPAQPDTSGLHPAAADLQHELAEDILNVDSDPESHQLVSVPPSEAVEIHRPWLPDVHSVHCESPHFAMQRVQISCSACWLSWPGFLMSITYIVSPIIPHCSVQMQYFTCC